MGTRASVSVETDQTAISNGAVKRWSKPTTDCMDPVTSLMRCACGGNDEKLSLLLKQGLDPNTIESENSR